MKNVIIILGLSFCYLTSFSQKTGTFTDPRDENVYKTVKIGSQWIMAENLAYKPAKGKYWAYKNDKSNVSINGYFYDWETAQKVAPAGWHLPSIEEWGLMYLYLSENNEKGYSTLIRSGSSGLDLTLSGCRISKGFRDFGYIGFYWSSTPSVGFCIWGNVGITQKSYKCSQSLSTGFSVRLFKDLTESEMWDEIKILNSIKGYLAFLSFYPQGIYADSAKLNLEKKQQEKLELFKTDMSPKEVVLLLKFDDSINETRFGGIFIGIGLLSEKGKTENSYTGTAVFCGYSFTFENGKLTERHFIIDEIEKVYFHGEYKFSPFGSTTLTSKWELKDRIFNIKTKRPDGGVTFEQTLTDQQ